MRPLELRLRNFRSFWGDDHRFDFRDRRLIGVVGPIGSGKSTILDAIAFALYGRTPRIGRSTKSLIHQRAEHATVALRFEVDGQPWEAVRQLRRVGPSQHALYRYPDDGAGDAAIEKVLQEREVNRRIEELLGLDYDAFGRSVLLAQGQFAQFLSSRPAERDKVLKGVFGYERIDAVRDLAKARVQVGAIEIGQLNIRIEHAELAKAKLDERRDELALAKARFHQLRDARPIFEELDGLINQAREAVEGARYRLGELGERAAELPDMKVGEQILTHAEAALAGLECARHGFRAADDSLGKAEAALRSEEYEECCTRLEDATQQVRRLEAGFEKTGSHLADLRDHAGDLPDLTESIVAVAEAEGVQVRRIEAKRDLDAATARLSDGEKVLATPDFKERERRLTEAERLVSRLESRREALLRESGDATRAAEAVESARRSAEQAEADLNAAHSELVAVEAAARDAASKLADAEQRLQDARHADMAGTLRDRLASGDTCPVCEQPVHQLPPSVGADTAAAQRSVEQARASRDSSEKRLRGSSGAMEAGKAGLADREERLAESVERLGNALVEEERQQNRVGEYVDRLEGLLGQGEPMVLVERERAAMAELRSAVEEARTALERQRLVHDAATEEERTAEGYLSDLRIRIVGPARMLRADFDIPDGEPGALRTALVALHTEWQQATDRLERMLGEERSELEKAASGRAEAQAAADSFPAAVKQARKVRDEARAVLDEAVSSEQASLREVSDLRARIGAPAGILRTDLAVPEGDPQAVRTALAFLHSEWRRTTSDLEQVISENLNTVEQTSARLEEARTEYGIEGSIGTASAEAGARCAQIASDLERDQQLVADVVDLVAELRKWRNRVRLNQRLVKDLTDSRFIRYLLDEERAVLADLGSKHFERLSSGRYRFTEDGQFHVVDLTAADAVRRADSLSGGETFVASLGLALGLAEMVGRRGGRLDAFFLDEGFGTLDPEHLDLAMKGIESLVAGREQRLVVVVSHVAELRHRIEDLIELDKNGVTGDSIVMSGATA